MMERTIARLVLVTVFGFVVMAGGGVVAVLLARATVRATASDRAGDAVLAIGLAVAVAGSHLVAGALVPRVRPRPHVSSFPVTVPCPCCRGAGVLPAWAYEGPFEVGKGPPGSWDGA